MAVNTNPPVQLHPDLDRNQSTAFINENFRKLSDSLSPFQISDGSNNILNIGKDSTGAYSMKVAKPGYDAFNASDANLIFNSNQNVLKVVTTGSVVLPTYTVTSGAGWAVSSVAIPPNAVVAHNIGGAPMVFAFMQVTGPGGATLLALPSTDSGLVGTAYYSTHTYFAINGTYMEIGQSTITNGNVGTMTAGGQTIVYWILQESAI